MSKIFSQALIERCITHFKEECGVDISTETANEYLHSFARLFLAMARPNYSESRHGTYVPCESPAVAEKDISNSLGVSNT